MDLEFKNVAEAIEMSHNKLDGRIDSLDAKIDALETKIDTKVSREIADLSEAIRRGFSEIDKLDKDKVSYAEHDRLVGRVSDIELKIA